jgi:hypothetical protein
MKYDILITHISGSKAKSIIARHLVHDLSISLQNAMEMLEKPPIPYMTGVAAQEAPFHLRQLEKIGVSAKLVEVTLKPLPIQNSTPFVLEKPPLLPEKPAEAIPKKAPVTVPQVHRIPERIEAQNAPEYHKSIFTKKRIRLILTIIILCTCGFIFYLVPKNIFHFGSAFTMDWSKSGIVSADSSQFKKGAALTDLTHQEKGNQQSQVRPDSSLQSSTDSTANSFPKTDVSKDSALHASTLIDSAQKIADINEVIAFFRMAIGFNKYNVAAWRGLYDAYLHAGMTEKATQTKEAMEKLFGADVFSLTAIGQQFGTVDRVNRSDDGIYRVEYKSNKSGNDRTLLDAYLFMKSLRGSCNCRAISLFAHTSGTGGVLVYASAQPFPETFGEFSKTARITILK